MTSITTREIDDLNKCIAKNKDSIDFYMPYEEEFRKLKEIEKRFDIN